MAWTKDQEEAIYTQIREANGTVKGRQGGKSVIVSAGAGSGKTAVLTERIIEILKSGADIRNLLVLTFTNAAASEMKERVRKKINESSDERIRAMSSIIDTADITTFDAYSLGIVKKYGYLLGVDSDIKIMDSFYSAVKMEKFVRDILAEYYLKGDERLVKLFSRIPNKNDDGLVYSILNMYESINLKPDMNDFLDNYMASFYSDDFINDLKDRYTSFLYKDLCSLKKYFEALRDELNNIRCYLFDSGLGEAYFDEEVMKFIDSYFDLIDSTPSFDILDAFLNKAYPEIPKMNAKGRNNEELKEQRADSRTIYKHIQNAFKKDGKIRKYATLLSLDAFMDSINKDREIVPLFIEIIKELENRSSKFKRERNAYEFMDVAKMAIKLVSIPEVNAEIKNNLYEILVDEYQDTSDIQETFINLISNNNVYTVGDIKQGIYRFRNANPYIFKDKYENYKDQSKGIKIDLIKNFRSRKEVLDDINVLFCDLMSDKYGDADYKRDHQMVFGQTDYITKGKKDENSNLEIKTYSLEEEDEEDIFDVLNGDGTIENHKDDETEAFIIANDIRNRIDSKEGVYSKDSGGLRPCEYSDFSILIDRTSKFEVFKKILESKKIPVAINADIPLNNDIITAIMANLVKLVILTKRKCYNDEYYHSLASIARSFIFEMDDTKLFEIIKSSQELEDVNGRKQVIYKEPADNEISSTAKKISSLIDIYSPSEIYSMIISEFKVMEKLHKIGNVTERMTIIEFLRTFAENVSEMGETFDDLADYMLSIIKSSNDVKYSVDTKNSPGVKIMTIHKSKGLEFPFCYFPMLHKKFNDSDTKTQIGFLSETGFFINEKDVINPVHVVASREIKEKDISEKIRLFYVALTRAREKMIIILQKRDESEIDSLMGMGYINSFNEMLYQYPETLEPYMDDVFIPSLGINRDYLKNKTYEYAYQNEKPKYEKNDYNGKIIERSRISKEVVEVLSDEEQENLDLGTRMHEIMEYMDFKNPDFSKISDSKIRHRIERLFESSPILKDVSKAIKHPEFEFSFEKDGKTYNGIIDCLLEYEDKNVIIDYKLYNIDHSEYDRQLSIYRDYVKSVDSEKPVYCYLLSLMGGNFREVK